MKKKYLYTTLSILLILCVLLGGCGEKVSKEEGKQSSKQNQQSTDKTAEDKPVTLKLAHWGSELDVETYKERAKLVSEEYPNITIEDQSIPNDGYDTKIQTMLAASECPDIVQLSESCNSYSSKGVLQSLDELSHKAGLDLEGRFGTSVKAYTWKGKLYAMPDRGGAMIVYYNKDMFDKAAVGYPSKDWTWDDFLEAAKKLTVAKDGKVEQFGFAAGGWWPWWMSFMYQNGGRILDENMEKVVVNSKENIEALNFYNDLVHKYHVAPSADDYSRFGLKDGQPDPLFAQGHCAMNITGFWNVGSLIKVEGLNWDMAPMWKNKEGGTVAFGSGLAIPKGSKNTEEAFKAIEFLTSEKGQEPIVKNNQDAPSNIKLLSSDLFLKPDWAKDKNLNFKAFADSADIIYSPPLHPKWNEIQRVFDQHLSVLLNKGGDSTETILKIEKDLKDLIEK